MGLFGTIQQSAGALSTAQVGLQVVGNNLANANTEGYIRQKLEQVPAVAFRNGNLIQGHGVRALGVTQVVDQALAERMFSAQSAASGSQLLSDAYNQLEEIASDLEGGGLNQQFSLFNNALHDLSTQPNDAAMREFVLIQGDSLANSLQQVRSRAEERKRAWNQDMTDMATQINRLSDRIAQLNVEIATIEGGRSLKSDATGLRDQRYRDLEELASYIDINIQEQENGNVSVFVGGDYLINNRHSREVYAAFSEASDGMEVRFRETDAALRAKGGKLGAAIEARGKVFGRFIKDVDAMAGALIRGVNEVHSQGQGRTGFDSVLASRPSETGVPLPEAELAFKPKNGSFELNVVDRQGELVSTTRVQVRQLGQVGDSTVQSIATQLDGIDGITASLTSDGRLQIESDSPSNQFTFGEDTSGFLAAAGINTFFTGENARDIAVNPVLKNDMNLLAVSRDGIGSDTETLYQMLDLVDRPLDSLDGRSITGLYEQIQSRLGREANLQTSTTEGLNDFYATLRSQHLAITGVNIDEESIKMVSYQRAFQASSRVIATAAEMLEILVNL